MPIVVVSVVLVLLLVATAWSAHRRRRRIAAIAAGEHVANGAGATGAEHGWGIHAATITGQGPTSAPGSS